MKTAYQPDKAVVEQFNALERKIEEVLGLINRLQQENRQLQERLNELERLRAEAIRQINTIIDKIEALL
jgi:chromosome segregation ATPase